MAHDAHSSYDASEQAEMSPVWLDHAAILTMQLEPAIAFYERYLGLALHVIEADPIRKGRRRAMLVDTGGRDVVEIIEMEELAHPAISGRGGLHHLGFLIVAGTRYARASMLTSIHTKKSKVAFLCATPMDWS